MTQAEFQITLAYQKIKTELEETFNKFMEDARLHPEDHDGVMRDDAYIWFIESF
jgi:hypothetical protein